MNKLKYIIDIFKTDCRKVHKEVMNSNNQHCKDLIMAFWFGVSKSNKTNGVK